MRKYGMLAHFLFPRALGEPKAGDEVMASGKVKWFDNKKGYGFIAQDTGEDIFVHHTSITGQGYKTLNEGETVNYEIEQGVKGLKAQNVQRAEA
jgi:CspA family cold shock protein